MNTTITAPFENGTLRLNGRPTIHLVSESDATLAGNPTPACMPGTKKKAVGEPTGVEITCRKCAARRDGVILGGYHGWTSR